MPELPEVETIIGVLRDNLNDKSIESLSFYYPRLLEEDSEYSLDFLVRKTFTDFKRRGKYLIFELDSLYYWVVHLRMEGKYHLYREPISPSKHTHLIFKADDTYVHYLDTRKFSRMAITTDLEGYFETKKLGLEPFDERLDAKYLKEAFKNTNRNIKVCLLDQSIVAGIGNIYADEVLYATEIHPLTLAKKLNMKELEHLVDAIQRVLHRAIKAGGTTIRSYTSSLGVSGRFQISLDAYGKENQPCRRCGTLMSRIKVGGRSSVFCERCQKIKR